MNTNIETAKETNNTYATAITRPDYVKIVTPNHKGEITLATLIAVEARNIRELGNMMDGGYIPRSYLRAI